MNRAYYIAVALIVFNLVAVFTGMLDVFPEDESTPGQNITLSADDSASGLAGIILPTDSTDRMVSIAGGMVSLALGVGAVYLTRSLTPLAVGAFASIYWVTLWKTLDIFNGVFWSFAGEGTALYYFTEFIIGSILTAVFIAAVIQIASGGWRSHV